MENLMIIKTVEDLKKYLDSLDPKTPLSIIASGYDVDTRSTVLLILPIDDNISLKAHIVDGVCCIENEDTNAMVCSPLFG